MDVLDGDASVSVLTARMSAVWSEQEWHGPPRHMDLAMS